MDEIGTVVRSFSGPFPHILLFFSLAVIVAWWTKEIMGVTILMIIWSVGAEFLQLYFPRAFDFHVTDIWWNLTGSSAGILTVQVAFVLCSRMFFKKSKSSTLTIEKDEANGDHT